ncbi:MAG TPA: glycosyltransferase, partial [Anaerolineae bacterium]|nr:glycosyltransferase [Anaerolineae bacterium]
RRQAPARLIVAGYPTKYISLPILRETAVNLGIADSVVFDARYIPIAEVGPLMELATVAVYPYLSSTQSGSLQVAYSFGRPVVATAVGGLPDVVEDGRSGFLVPPANPEALGEALGKIISSPALAQEMGAYARHLSQTRFAWGPIGAQILAVYEAKADQG